MQESLNLRADSALQARIDELADRCDQGALTQEERAEYESCVRFGNFIPILQAKARLRQEPRAAQ